MRAYTLNQDVESAHGAPLIKGTMVFQCTGEDLGSVAEEARLTGVACMAVTTDRLGFYPFTVVPVSTLDPIEINDLPALTTKHVDDQCKIGQGGDCCRYLVGGKGGLECGKLRADIRMQIDARVETMHAKGDNCPGRIGNP